MEDTKATIIEVMMAIEGGIEKKIKGDKGITYRDVNIKPNKRRITNLLNKLGKSSTPL